MFHFFVSGQLFKTQEGNKGGRNPSLSIQQYFLVVIDDWEEKEISLIPNGLVIKFESYECPFDLYSHIR